MHAKSFAKLNLFLHILSRNLNNYHQIQSYLLRISLFDEVKIESAVRYECKVIGADIENNIVDKVISLLKYCLNQDMLFRITIKKNIPIAAGLGGGSSNAAVVLQLLLEHFKVSQSLRRNIYLKAQKIGADLAFFLQNNNAFVEGIGNVVTPVLLQETFYLLLVNTGLKISAKYAYSSCYEEDFLAKIVCNKKNIKNSIFFGKNGLERCMKQKYSELNNLLSIIKMQKNCLVSRMSGSGATCFGLFNKLDDLNRARKELASILPCSWIYSERVLL